MLQDENWKKNSKKLVSLAKRYPDLQIVPATSYEVVADDTFMYWFGKIHSVEVDYLWFEGERVWISKGEIMERLQGIYEEDEKAEHYSDKEFDLYLKRKFKEQVKEGTVKKAIVLFITV